MPAPQECQQAGQRILRADHESERRRNGAGHKPDIPQCAEIDKENLLAQSIELPVPDRDGDGGLADAAGADDGHETMLRKFACNLLDGFGPPDHFGRWRGQGPDRAYAAGRRRGRWFGTGDGSGKAIAATRDVDDISRADCTTTKGLAQCGDVEAEAALVDIHVRPDLFDKVAFVHDLTRTFRQEDQNVERAPADMKWSAIFLQ